MLSPYAKTIYLWFANSDFSTPVNYFQLAWKEQRMGPLAP